MTFDDAYKTITNNLGKFEPEDFVTFVTTRLRLIEDKGAQSYQGNFPWNYLLLLKLIWFHGGKSNPTKKIDDVRLNNLMSRLYDLDKESPPPFLTSSQPHGVFKFLRTIANQQFWAQLELGKWNIARQSMILEELDQNDPIRVRYREAYGIEPMELLQLLFVIWAWIVKSPNNYVFEPHELFKHLNYSTESIATFLKLFSLSNKTAREYLMANKPVKSSFLESYEMSPFVRKPFFETRDGRFIVYSNKVLQQCIKTFFYYGVTTLGGSELKERFAEVFESYVGKVIGGSFSSVRKERELQAIFPNSRVTDYLIQEEEGQILVEVKAQDINESVRVFSADVQLKNELEDSVTKATTQAFELISSINKSALKSTGENYLVIVTFIQFNLGNGPQIYSEFLQQAIQPFLVSKGIDPELIPPGHIFVADIEEWEIFISALNNSRSGCSILKLAGEENANPQTSKFHFGQHLDKYLVDNPPFKLLEDQFARFVDEIHSRFTTLD